MLIILAATCFFFSLVFSLDMLFGLKSMTSLKDYQVTQDKPYPSLSIVFAARNEERNMERAVRSLLEIDYPNLEIIAVNDRSTDSTPHILDKIAKEHKKLKLLTINELPKGWLGKNHALYEGAKQSSSELLLFTDADVHFEMTAIKRAVSCLIKEKCDHVTLMPQMHVQSFFLNLYVSVFGLLFFSFIRPWKVKDPKSKCFLGVGAFNLLKRTTYEKIGTMAAIRLRPDDDIKLGKLIKLNQFKQIALKANSFVSVEWYRSVKEFVKGLEKNIYAGADYRFFFMVLSTLSLITLFVVPYGLIGFTEGKVFSLFLSTIILQLTCYIVACTGIGTTKKTFILFPFGVIFYIYVIWNAIGKTIYKNGIEWRGTFYNLDELKSNKI